MGVWICIERDRYDYFKVFSFQGWMDNCLEAGQSRISGSKLRERLVIFYKPCLSLMNVQSLVLSITDVQMDTLLLCNLAIPNHPQQ